jgi:hypothetical protein
MLSSTHLLSKENNVQSRPKIAPDFHYKLITITIDCMKAIHIGLQPQNRTYKALGRPGVRPIIYCDVRGLFFRVFGYPK